VIEHLIPLPLTPGPGAKTTVWAAADGYGWDESSIFSLHFPSVLFPIWPTELVDALSADDATRRVAQASAALYANLTCAPGFPEPPYETCVDAGWGALTVFSALARALPALPGDKGVVNATTLADAFENYVNAYGANSTNFLGYAPGGGVENTGLAQAVNDMLLRSSNGTLHLFPAWPAEEPASFTTLRAKGGFLVSSSWDHITRTASAVSVRATVDGMCILASPWGSVVDSVDVDCKHPEGQQPTGAAEGNQRQQRGKQLDSHRRLSWFMYQGELCNFKPVTATAT